MDWIRNLNNRYDKLDDTHPNLRFLLFFIPAGILLAMINQPFSWNITLFGLIGLALMCLFRLAPIAFPKRD